MMTKHGDLEMLPRTEKAEEFHCARCDQDKKAKAKALWTKLGSSISVVICNGCYGNLLSQK